MTTVRVHAVEAGLATLEVTDAGTRGARRLSLAAGVQAVTLIWTPWKAARTPWNFVKNHTARHKPTGRAGLTAHPVCAWITLHA